MLTVGTNKTKYAIDEMVHITLTVSNNTSEAQTYEFNTSQRYDVVVQDGREEKWRWSNGQYFLEVLNSMTLEPGETVVYNVEWPQVTSEGQAVGAGLYVIIGTITSSNRSEQAATTILIG